MMDDLIERLRRDLLNLAPAQAPFEDLRKRATRRGSRRRVGAGVVGIVVAAVVVAGVWAVRHEGDGATVTPGSDTPADRLFLAGDGEAWIVDPGGETVRHLSLPELPPGDAPYRVVRRGDALVAWAYRTLVLRPTADSVSVSTDVLVPDSLLFIPSSSPDRVWVGIVDEGQDDGRLTAVREVSIDGQVSVPDVRPPNGAWPVAAVGGNLVFQRGGELFVWDPATGQDVARLPGQLPIAWQGSLLAWCDAACGSLHVMDLVSGRRLTVEPPAGATGFDALYGAFSPDGSTLAVALRLGDGEDAGRQLALIDVRTGEMTVVEGATVPTPYVFIDWAPSGETVFITGGQHGGHRQIIEYRVGEAAARVLDVSVGDFYGVAAFESPIT